MHVIRPLLASVVLLTLSGCDFSSEPGYARAPGELVMNESSPVTISVPDEVRRGVPTPVTVTTAGVGGCTELGDTEVAVVDGVVEIRPYDHTLVLRRNEACTMMLVYLPHTVNVTFSEAGPAIIRAVGEYRVSTSPSGVVPQIAELGIVVR